MPATNEALMVRARAFMQTPEFKRLWRYATVSAVTTVVSLTALYIFYRVLKIGSAAESNVLATAIATVPSYYFNRTWAWGKSGPSHLMREVVPFWVIAFISLVLSTLAVDFAATEAHHVTHSHMLTTGLILFANLFTYAVLWVAKFVFFNKLLFNPDAKPNASDQLVSAVKSPGDQDVRENLARTETG